MSVDKVAQRGCGLHVRRMRRETHRRRNRGRDQSVRDPRGSRWGRFRFLRRICMRARCKMQGQRCVLRGASWCRMFRPNIPVQPVGNVERSIRSERKDVVCGDRLCLACPLQHEELRQDGHSLEVDAERPHDLHKVEMVVEEQCQNEARAHEILQLDRVDSRIVRRSEPDLHQVQDIDRRTDEEDLHQETVERSFMKQVHVARHKDDRVEQLGFERDAST